MSRTPERQDVLVVDDESDLRELLALSLLRMGVDCDTAATVAQAREYLTRSSYGLVLTDMQLPDGSGLDVVSMASAADQTPVAVITAFGSAENAVAALKAGAFDYVEKPIELAALKRLVKGVLKRDATSANEKSSSNISRAKGLSLLGDSPVMLQVREMIAKLARTMAPVAITGPSGSGKELAARMIHGEGVRASGPFIAVNCGAIPEHLMEAEFFGYRKGAFTGANEDRDGFFQAANGGTLLLDEVADLPLPMQVKLLRAIQERKVRKVGATQEESVDVRIISATHKNLAAMAADGQFRQDLYYRLNVIELVMPALAERREDIAVLAEHMIGRICERHQQPVARLSADAARLLATHHFPGNVRELENVLERALALAVGPGIGASDVASALASSGMAAPLRNIAEPVIESAGPAVVSGVSAASGTQVSSVPPVTLPMDLEGYLDNIERGFIEQALLQTRYNRTQAASLLGLSFRQFRYRMQRLGIK
jgi:two-component system response regulator PilR (NtrC family)